MCIHSEMTNRPRATHAELGLSIPSDMRNGPRQKKIRCLKLYLDLLTFYYPIAVFRTAQIQNKAQVAMLRLRLRLRKARCISGYNNLVLSNIVEEVSAAVSISRPLSREGENLLHFMQL